MDRRLILVVDEEAAVRQSLIDVLSLDGHVDLIIPPERGTGQKTPQIFLGDGPGKWNRWAIRWPRTLDYGNVVVHMFDEETREFYALEEFWSEATAVPLPWDKPAEPAAPSLSKGPRVN